MSEPPEQPPQTPTPPLRVRGSSAKLLSEDQRSLSPRGLRLLRRLAWVISAVSLLSWLLSGLLLLPALPFIVWTAWDLVKRGWRRYRYWEQRLQ